MEVLDQMGINNYSMFPDLEGASLDCNIRLNKGPGLVYEREHGKARPTKP